MDDTATRIIQKHISDMHAHAASGMGDRQQRPLMAQVQFIIAEEQAKSADKLERQTDRLVEETVQLTKFTRGLVWLTLTVASFAFIQIVIMLFEYCAKLHGSP